MKEFAKSAKALSKMPVINGVALHEPRLIRTILSGKNSGTQWLSILYMN
jgi:hypothetical protein